jgi:hypothetical protein
MKDGSLNSEPNTHKDSRLDLDALIKNYEENRNKEIHLDV